MICKIPFCLETPIFALWSPSLAPGRLGGVNQPGKQSHKSGDNYPHIALHSVENSKGKGNQTVYHIGPISKI